MSPLGPTSPWDPTGPMMPCFPLFPGDPIIPWSPLFPLFPFCPLRPQAPFCPRGPGGPGGPGGPDGHVVPYEWQRCGFNPEKICSVFASFSLSFQSLWCFHLHYAFFYAVSNEGGLWRKINTESLSTQILNYRHTWRNKRKPVAVLALSWGINTSITL